MRVLPKTVAIKMEATKPEDIKPKLTNMEDLKATMVEAMVEGTSVKMVTAVNPELRMAEKEETVIGETHGANRDAKLLLTIPPMPVKIPTQVQARY